LAEGPSSLAFTDLIGVLLKVNLGLLKPDMFSFLGLGTSFKLIYFASGSSANEPIAFPLLEALEKVT
jgi:hypothetical protein